MLKDSRPSSWPVAAGCRNACTLLVRIPLAVKPHLGNDVVLESQPPSVHPLVEAGHKVGRPHRGRRNQQRADDRGRAIAGAWPCRRCLFLKKLLRCIR